LNDQKLELKKSVAASEEQFNLLNQNLNITSQQRDDYKSLYVKSAEELAKAPNRATWFTTGFVSAIIVVVLGIIFIGKK
jgi:hypothetical protein